MSSHFNASNIDSAVAHIFLASLDCSSSLILYENPLQEIAKRCEAFKIGLNKMFQEGDDPFPKCLNQNIKDAITDRLVRNDWGKKVDEEEILKLKKQFVEELKDDLGEETSSFETALFKEKDTNFILRLKNLPFKERKEILLNWDSSELEKVFDKVKQAKQVKSTPKKQFDSQANYDSVLEKMTGTNKDIRIRNRETAANHLHVFLEKARVLPSTYTEGKSVPRKQWISSVYLDHWLSLHFKTHPFLNKHPKDLVKYEADAWKNMLNFYKKEKDHLPKAK